MVMSLLCVKKKKPSRRGELSDGHCCCLVFNNSSPLFSNALTWIRSSLNAKFCEKIKKTDCEPKKTKKFFSNGAAACVSCNDCFKHGVCKKKYVVGTT